MSFLEVAIIAAVVLAGVGCLLYWYRRRLAELRDRHLTKRWVRFLLFPVLIGAPAAFASLWFGIHKATTPPTSQPPGTSRYLLEGYEAQIMFATAVWAGVMSALREWAQDVIKTSVA